MTHFMDLNGRICCTDCLGSAASAELRHKPKARQLRTSLTVWDRLTVAEVAEFVADCGIVGPACESCRYTTEVNA